MTIRTVDEYVKAFPKGVASMLNKLRRVIRKAAPEAEEVINYGIPTYRLKGNLVHFAAFKKHIGFYPTPSGINKFKNELSEHKYSRGSVQFLLDKPIPYGLIRKIVMFRVKESLAERISEK